MLLCILLYKKQRLPSKYLLQLYSNCCYTEQWQNLAISSTTWRRARSVSLTRRHIFTHEHFSTNPYILSSGYHVLHLFMPLFCCTSVLSRLCTLNFYILQIYEQSESPVPSRTNLSCRRGGLPTLCKDLEL